MPSWGQILVRRDRFIGGLLLMSDTDWTEVGVIEDIVVVDAQVLVFVPRTWRRPVGDAQAPLVPYRHTEGQFPMTWINPMTCEDGAIVAIPELGGSARLLPNAHADMQAFRAVSLVS